MKEKYFKIFNEGDNHYGFQYKDGLNIDTNPFNDNPEDSCVKGGLYFTNAKNICSFLHYGDYVREVELIKGQPVILDPDKNKWRTPQLFLHSCKSLGKVGTWKSLYESGANINEGVQWASANGKLNVVKYLHQNGADIKTIDNHPTQLASRYGHLQIVRYLHQNGADITTDDNYAIKRANKYGHLEVVKYLKQNGAVLK